MAQCFELSLLPGIKNDDFEKGIFTEVFPKLEILRRNVRSTTHRLLRIDEKDSAPQKYIWLVFASLVGDTPQTAGEGPEVLASDLIFVSEAAELLAKYATLASFTEVSPA